MKSRSDKDGIGWEGQGFGGTDGKGDVGVVWYRTTIPKLSEQRLTFAYLVSSMVDEQARIYLNGQAIGERFAASEGKPIDAIWAEPSAVNVSHKLSGTDAMCLAGRVHDGALNGRIHRPVYMVVCDHSADLSELLARCRVTSKQIGLRKMDQDVRRIGADWQLFIDDSLIRRSTGLDRVVHHPRSHGVVIAADCPWESVGLGLRRVIRTDDGKFIAFYRAMWFDPSIAESDPAHRNDRAHHIAAAEAMAVSDDGVHWTKPNLSRVDSPAAVDTSASFPKPIGQTRDNNLGVPFVLVADLHRHGNCRDTDRRFALRLNAGASRGVAVGETVPDRGYFARELPDFVNDAQWADKLIDAGGAFAPRGRAIHFWDEIHREWVAIEQGVIGHWIPSRDIGRFASSDFTHWTARTVFYPDALDSHRIERYDEPMFMMPYCSEGVVFGLLSWYHSDRSHPDGGPTFAPTPEHPARWPWCRKGTCEIRITISRDGGHTWDRTSSREAWIPHSIEHDAFDRLVISPTPPVTVGDEDWFYVGVIDGDHLSIRNNDGQSTYYHDRFPKHQVALYTQKRNRYVSLSASSRTETLITQPMILDGDTLQLNVDAGHGEVRVAIVSAEPFPLHDGRASVDAPHLLTDKALDGFSFDDCIPIRTNSIEENVRFASGASLASLKGRSVILLFPMNDADLYGFRAISMNR